MIRHFMHGFSESMLSFRTIGAVLVVGAFGLMRLSLVAGNPGVNSWDAIVPMLTDSLVITMVGLTWWCFWLIPEMTALSNEQTLIRYGSRAAAVLKSLAKLSGVMVAWVLFLIVLSFVIGLPLGLETAWSASAKETPIVQPSAFSAQAFAGIFPNPLIAITASGLYTGASYLVIAALALAASVRNWSRSAVLGLVSFTIWSVICSLTPVPIPTIIDSSVSLSLGWALVTTNGIMHAMLWLGAGVCVVLAFVNSRFTRRNARAILTSRMAAVAVLLFIVVVSTVNAASTSVEGSSAIRQFFAGAYGDLVTYILVAALPIGIVTTFLARMSESIEGQLLYEALRRGSFRRWTGVALLREFGLAMGFYVITGVAIVLTLAAIGENIEFTNGDGAVLFIGLMGLLAVTLLLLALVATMIWTPASPVAAWPITIGLSLVVGYAIPSTLGGANIAAPYSIPQDSPSLTLPAIASTVTLICALVVAAVSMRRATPINAENIA